MSASYRTIARASIMSSSATASPTSSCCSRRSKHHIEVGERRRVVPAPLRHRRRMSLRVHACSRLGVRWRTAGYVNLLRRSRQSREIPLTPALRQRSVQGAEPLRTRRRRSRHGIDAETACSGPPCHLRSSQAGHLVAVFFPSLRPRNLLRPVSWRASLSRIGDQLADESGPRNWADLTGGGVSSGVTSHPTYS